MSRWSGFSGRRKRTRRRRLATPLHCSRPLSVCRDSRANPKRRAHQEGHQTLCLGGRIARLEGGLSAARQRRGVCWSIRADSQAATELDRQTRTPVTGSVTNQLFVGGRQHPRDSAAQIVPNDKISV